MSKRSISKVPILSFLCCSIFPSVLIHLRRKENRCLFTSYRTAPTQWAPPPEEGDGVGLFPAQKPRNKCLFSTPERREKERPRSCRLNDTTDYKEVVVRKASFPLLNSVLPSLRSGHSVTPGRAGTGESREERKREGPAMEGKPR